jgi:hypothetical protein
VKERDERDETEREERERESLQEVLLVGEGVVQNVVVDGREERDVCLWGRKGVTDRRTEKQKTSKEEREEKEDRGATKERE